MKHLFPLFVLGMFCSSCVDKDYDLSKLDTDNVTIGDQTSEFRIPLATIRISMSEVGTTDMNLEALFDEADTWLPSPLPGNNSYVDLTALRPGSSYTDNLLAALITQLQTDDAKLTKVTDLIWSKYSVSFLPLLNLPGGVNETQFKAAFKVAFRAEAAIRDEARRQAQSYLVDLSVDDLKYSVGKIDLGNEVIDMLAKNLDPKGTPNAKNTLHLYGEVTSSLPLNIRLSPAFTSTDVKFSVDIDPKTKGTISETQLFESDLRKIIEGVDIVIPVGLLRYYPGEGFSDDQQIAITLRLVKRGGLKLNL